MLFIIVRCFNPAGNQSIIMLHDGNLETEFFNVTAVFGFASGVGSNVVINDNGAVAAWISQTPSSTSPCGTVYYCLVRINPNKTFTVLATAGPFGGGTADFVSFHPWLSFNNAGQVAIGVRNNDTSDAFVRIDDTGITEIVRSSADFILPGRPSISDSGTVAFVAQAPTTPQCPAPPSCIMVFTGAGGALTIEGREPSGGGSGFGTFINNNGLVLGTGVGAPGLIYTAQGGLVNVLVVGDEDPVFTVINNQPSQNDFGDFVFGSRNSGFPVESGLFTGNDPTQDKVVRLNDILFGGSVSDIRTNLHYINNNRQIVFAITVTDPSGNFSSHIVRADLITAGRELIVSNTADSGPGSLRQAILDGRGDGLTTIKFDPSLLPATINVLSRLPALTDSGDRIDGGGQITLNGVGLTATSDHGLRILAPNITVTGLTVQNFGGSGIRIQTNGNLPTGPSDQVLTGIVVSNNIVTKNLDGIVLAGGQSNNRFEVTITGNALTQNSSDGIVVNGSDSTGNGGNIIDVRITNNSISGSAGSDSALSGDGIRVTGGQGDNVGNNVVRVLISNNLSQKNADEGIRVAGAGTGSSSSNNQIDATVTGNTSKSNGVPNGGNGITVAGGPTVTVPATTSGNLITFLVDNNQATNNTGNGIGIQGNAGSGHVVRGSITNNQFNSNSAFGMFLQGRGSFNTLENIDIQFNQVTKNGDRGLVIFGGDSVNTDNAAITNVLLNGNTVSNNGHHGIVADLGTGPGNSISFAAITDNTANANGTQGIWILSGINGNGTTRLARNRADRNKNSGRDGINISSTGHFLTGNGAQANARFGITAIGNAHDGTNVSRRNGDSSCDPAGCF
jgi:hypothetical protein